MKFPPCLRLYFIKRKVDSTKQVDKSRKEKSFFLTNQIKFFCLSLSLFSLRINGIHFKITQTRQLASVHHPPFCCWVFDPFIFPTWYTHIQLRNFVVDSIGQKEKLPNFRLSFFSFVCCFVFSQRKKVRKWGWIHTGTTKANWIAKTNKKKGPSLLFPCVSKAICSNRVALCKSITRLRLSPEKVKWILLLLLYAFCLEFLYFIFYLHSVTRCCRKSPLKRSDDLVCGP